MSKHKHHTSKTLIKIKRSNDVNLLQTLCKTPNEYRSQRGEWLSTAGSSFAPGAEEVDDQVQVSDA
jgi:hypothetical protein